MSECCFAAVMKLIWSANEEKLLQNSWDAFCLNFLTRTFCQRKADTLNGIVVLDSDTNDPQQYVGLPLTSDRLQEVVAKQRQSIKGRNIYLLAKSLAERNYGRRNKSVKGIVKLFLDIGNTIETYIQQGKWGQMLGRERAC